MGGYLEIKFKMKYSLFSICALWNFRALRRELEAPTVDTMVAKEVTVDSYPALPGAVPILSFWIYWELT